MIDNLAPAFTWWLTGLPAAGKSTLAQALARTLQAMGESVAVLDGDVLRTGLCQDLGFSDADRMENMRRVAEVAVILNRCGTHAIVALVSPTRAGRDRARQILGTQGFIEVHVSTSLEVCRQRDPKGLYARAAQDPAIGLTGVQAPYEAPLAADLSIDTARLSIEEATRLLIGARELKKA